MIIRDPRLGVLRRNGSSLSGTFVLRDRTVELRIELGSVGASVARARTIVRGARRLSSAAKHYASKKLRRLKNSTWEDETTPVTDLQFRRRLTLTSIDIAPELEVTFWFHDGDLFWGHFVTVEMNARDRFTFAELLG